MSRLGFKVMIGNEDVSDYCIYPINFQFTLDDALDQAYIELRNSPVTDAYDPFTFVSIKLYPQLTEYTWYISVDNCVINQKTGLANHKILLIEETKILERVICRAKSFVRPLIKKYDSGNTKAPIALTDETFGNVYRKYGQYFGNILDPNALGTSYQTSSEYIRINQVPMVYNTSDTLSVYDIFSVINQGNIIMASSEYHIVVVNAITGAYVADSRNSLSFANIPINDTYTVYAVGNWSFTFSGGSSVGVKIATAIDISVLSNTESTAPRELFVTPVINQLLEIAEPIKRGETPRFTLNQADALRYANTPCAELNFANGASLWENLLEIGKVIHCIPRLRNSVVYFDKLGDGAEITQKQLFRNHISQTSDKTSEKFASHLDSVVNGLMNLDDEGQGAISDPFERGFRTVRSEISNTDMRTTVDSCIVRTVEPIEKVTKVTVVYSNVEYDITPYIYEKKEYDLLYSNQGSYPYAKAYALYYVQGQPNIYGLTYKEQNPISPIFENYAIENILKEVSGNSLNADDWEPNSQGTDPTEYAPDGLLNLAFNVKYITSINGRVRQSKRNVEDIKTVAVMAFNQAANRLSSVNYGKRLKGEIAMMGSADVKICYKHLPGNFDDVVESVGKRFPYSTFGSNMYISSATIKYWGQYIVTELGLTKNFNQLGRFVAINSAVRQFEIDTNVSESFFLDEEYLVFSEGFSEDDAPYTISNGSRLRGFVLSVISGNVAANGNKVTVVTATTSTELGTTLRTVFLPVQSLALGNSLLFNFKYEDNYSAGETLVHPSNKNYKLSQMVPYGDALYGEAKYLSIILGYDSSISSSNIVSAGDALPLQPTGFSATSLALTGDPYIVNKSSRDALNVTYQIHFVTDCGLIFGEQLMQGNPLVGGTISDVPKNGANPIIYLYSGRVNEMTGESDTPHIGTALLNYASYNTYAQLVASGATTDDYNSWNIKDVNGRVLLAKNGKFNTITYYTRRKIGG
jgi:hypothetical protein